MIFVALACPLVALTALGILWNDGRRFRQHLARAEAARAAEAPCEALTHVRIVPAGEMPAAELSSEKDLSWRICEALNVFAENNGLPVPIPTLWLAIAVEVSTAILGEDLAPVLVGPDEGEH